MGMLLRRHHESREAEQSAPTPLGTEENGETLQEAGSDLKKEKKARKTAKKLSHPEEGDDE